MAVIQRAGRPCLAPWAVCVGSWCSVLTEPTELVFHRTWTVKGEKSEGERGTGRYVKEGTGVVPSRRKEAYPAITRIIHPQKAGPREQS